MAITPNGLYNNPNGKIGNMVFYTLRGQLVSRKIGKPGNPSVPQLANRQAMAITMDVLKGMVGFINEGFYHQSVGTTKNQFNLATSYNKKNALQGVYPNLSVDYSKLLLSNGKLDSPVKTTMVKTETGVEVSWDGYNDKNCKGDDMAMIILYHPVKGRETTVFYAAKRSDGKCFIPVHERWLAEPLEAYMFFKASNGKAVSDSVYLGNLNGEVETVEQVVVKGKDKRGKDRFKVIKAQYLAEFNDAADEVRMNKSRKNLKLEYEVLKKRFDEPPGN